MFGIGPAYLFLLRHRLPLGRRGSRRDWLSTMATNLAIALLVAGLIWLVGTGPFLMVQLPITLAAGIAGVWLFYVQHQFEDKIGRASCRERVGRYVQILVVPVAFKKNTKT